MRLYMWSKAASVQPPRRRGARNPAVSKNPGMFVRAAPGPGRSACRPTVVVGPQRKGGIRNRTMHGMQKSDTGVVAMKLANKGADPPAEPMERRTVPEGNSEGQSTRQAQDWASVSQAVDRIRQFVHREPRKHLTTLLHHVTVDALRWAFFSLKKNAAGRRRWPDVARVRTRSGRPAGRPA